MPIKMEEQEKELRKCLDCGICLELLLKPVTTSCGHNFCRGCLISVYKRSIYRPKCPMCRLQLSKTPLKVNLLLDYIISCKFPDEYKQRISNKKSFEKVSPMRKMCICILRNLSYWMMISIPVLVALILYRKYNLPAQFLSKVVKLIRYPGNSKICQILISIGYIISCYVDVISDIY